MSTSASVIRDCEKCGQRNRVPVTKLARTGRCGACKAALQPLARPLSVDAKSFDEIVKGADVPVLVDFWAEWCGPCKMAAPHVDRVAQEMSGRAIVLKVDTEANPDLARRYRIQSIPNFAIFKDGALAMQQPGLVDAARLRAWLEQVGA